MIETLDTLPLTGNYFVSAYPPFSCWNESGIPAWRELLRRPPAGDPAEFGIYVHVPFCVERCQYCYYLSYDNRPEEMRGYAEAAASELRRYASTPYLSGRNPSFLYFGGGTPSLLPVAVLRPWMQELQGCFSWKNACEITFECAPRSVGAEKARLLREAGVTRISLGVQQLDDGVLQKNGRIHLVADVERAWRILKQEGFPVVNIDLIAGLAGETDESFFGSLDRALELEPDSVTIYLLEIPLNTPLYRSLESHAAEIPGWPVKRERLRAAMERMAADGYEMRSAYTAVKRGSTPEFVYQDAQYRGADLLGIGASAFSYLSGVHHQNLASLASYMEAIRQGELPLWRACALGPREQMVREFILQMKIGVVDCGRLEKKYSINPLDCFQSELERLAGKGMLICEGAQVRLTQEGLLRVDHLVREFYLPQHRGIRYS